MGGTVEHHPKVPHRLPLGTCLGLAAEALLLDVVAVLAPA